MTRKYPSNGAALHALIDLTGKRALDVGCGRGELVAFMNKNGASAAGLECNPLQIEAAKERDPVVPIHEGVGEDMPFDDATFDLVVFMFSLHHVPMKDQAGALAEAARVLKPGGTLYVAEPLCEGSGFEVHRPVDNETEVRTAALSALRGVPADTLTSANETIYEMSYHYRMFEEFKDEMVRIDPARRESFEAQEDHLQNLFKTLGVPEEQGIRFDQPVRVNIFTKSQ